MVRCGPEIDVRSQVARGRCAKPLAVSFSGEAIDEHLHVCDPLELGIERRLHARQYGLHSREPIGPGLRSGRAVASGEAERAHEWSVQ